MPLFGSLFDFRRDMPGFLTKIAKKYGDIVYFKLGPQKAFLLNHPDFIKDVLVTNHRNFLKGPGIERSKPLLGNGLLNSEGDFHLRQRRIIQPGFHHTKIATYGKVMVEYASNTSEKWQEGVTLDMHNEMMRLTLAIVGKTLFDADVDTEAGEICRAVNEFIARFPRSMLPFSGLLDKLPLPSNRRIKKSLQRLDSTIYRMIEERRASKKDRGDLLSMLLLARDEEGDRGGMTDLQVRDEAMTLFLAGHETTANALTWTWYLLSQHPEVEDQLHQELDKVLDSRPPNVEDFEKLSYTRRVFAEAMRLYPPAWTMARRVREDYRVGGYVIPANAVIIMSQYVMHRDPRYYPNSFRFDPERWAPEQRDSRPQFAYFPFGGGPRRCIGESFAWMEGILVIATLAQKWKMRLVPGHRVKLQPSITLRPKYGMQMMLEQR
jgi:cytochrome P450